MAAKRTRRGQINTDNNIKEMNRVRSGIYDRRPNAGHGFSRNFLQVMSWSGGKADGRSYPKRTIDPDCHFSAVQFELSDLWRSSSSDDAPNNKHNNGPHHGADKARRFTGLIPANRLSETGRYKRTSDAKQCRDNDGLAKRLSIAIGAVLSNRSLLLPPRVWPPARLPVAILIAAACHLPTEDSGTASRQVRSHREKPAHSRR